MQDASAAEMSLRGTTGSPLGLEIVRLSETSLNIPLWLTWLLGRSPCPLLNAMANHGWLPRNGKALTLPMIQTALDDALGFEQDIFINITEAALAVSTTGNASTFNLQDTARHNAIEHDGSLSRNDFFFGDNLHFNLRIWRVTAARYGIGVPSNTSLLTVDVAARARAARIEDARRVNPNFTLTSSGLMGSYGETSVLLTTFWQAENAGAPKEWVRVLFGKRSSLSDVVSPLIKSLR